MAAVLACGDNAVLSHRSAAALWALLPVPGGRIEVIAPGGGRGGRSIALRRADLDPRDRTVRDGIPVTTVNRTLVDLAAVINARRLEQVAEQAERRGLVDLSAIERMLGESGRRRGSGSLRRVLGSKLAAEPLTRSNPERDFLRLCKRAGLPLPTMNTTVEGYEVDAFWSDERAIVEIDGWEYHRTAITKERDDARDAALVLAGYRVLRFSAWCVAARPKYVIASIRALLRSGPGI